MNGRVGIGSNCDAGRHACLPIYGLREPSRRAIKCLKSANIEDHKVGMFFDKRGKLPCAFEQKRQIARRVNTAIHSEHRFNGRAFAPGMFANLE